MPKEVAHRVYVGAECQLDIGHPILGDTVYGHKKAELGQDSQCLHAGTLCFAHPRDGHPVMVFAELPPYFKEVIQKLEKMG